MSVVLPGHHRVLGVQCHVIVFRQVFTTRSFLFRTCRMLMQTGSSRCRIRKLCCKISGELQVDWCFRVLIHLFLNQHCALERRDGYIPHTFRNALGREIDDGCVWSRLESLQISQPRMQTSTSSFVYPKNAHRVRHAIRYVFAISLTAYLTDTNDKDHSLRTVDPPGTLG
jgi:hypothetical protein